MKPRVFLTDEPESLIIDGLDGWPKMARFFKGESVKIMDSKSPFYEQVGVIIGVVIQYTALEYTIEVPCEDHSHLTPVFEGWLKSNAKVI